MAQNYLVKNNLDSARREIDQALLIDPNHPGANNFKAKLLIIQKYPQKALEYYNISIYNDPNFIGSLYSRGVLYLDLQMPQKALSDFNTVQETSPHLVYNLLC